MIIGGNSSDPITFTPSSDFSMQSTGSFGSFGSSGAYFTGASHSAPFNPYGPSISFNPYNIVGYDPFTAPIDPISTGSNVSGGGGQGQVVYAHYGANQALAGQTQNTTANVSRPTTTSVPAATPKPAEEPKPAEAAKPAEAPKPAEEPKPEPKPEPKTVTVASGDNLSKIAKANGTTWQKIYELNKDVIGKNPNLIKPGQVLKMP